jgi:hypothetical protein
LRNDRKGAGFWSFNDVYPGVNERSHLFSKKLSGVTVIGQYAQDFWQVPCVLFYGDKCAVAVSDIGGGNGYGVWQSLAIHENMPFGTRDLLARIMTFASCTVGVFHALGINDAKTRFHVATLFGTRLANLFFLMPVLAGLYRLPTSLSTAKGDDVPSATSGSHSAASARQ